MSVRKYVLCIGASLFVLTNNFKKKTHEFSLISCHCKKLSFSSTDGLLLLPRILQIL